MNERQKLVLNIIFRYVQERLDDLTEFEEGFEDISYEEISELQNFLEGRK